ncbi:Cpn60_TCP1 domain-containing protein/PIP5K domain-containing protein [Cephalotus follicularis]|uniref:1-phosphatidylinositol-3-phosphate 5-kinase n=1 Tax=Cephalotus follicularis TaxID=3775 RepID=A0A1Q3D3S7_CEPFO|nr:Cpn60_TCP1 domain-containing protein/PIP5K domain-containing protein [Cephalotus follicularis]
MSSTCHYCGAELVRLREDRTEQENENSLKSDGGGQIRSSDGGGQIRSCKICAEKHDREYIKQHSPFATPIISPTTSLLSSDLSVDVNSYHRGDKEGGAIDGSQDLNYRLNGCQQNSSLEGPVNGVSRVNTVTETKLKDSNYNDRNTVRDVEIMQSSSGPEVQDNAVGNATKSFIYKSQVFHSIDDKMDSQIWEPPEAEDPKEDLESSVAYDDDGDDECGDGTKWGKPSNLSHYEVEGSGSYKFKEEKQRAMEEVINGRFKDIVSHLLNSVGVATFGDDGESWLDVVSSLSWEAASFLKPDAIDGQKMDLDGHVKVKCIATGSRGQSQIIKGLVFKKHPAHKHMPNKYKNPRLLLLKGALGQSSSGLSSFNSMMQEKGQLQSVIEMIETCHPNVVLVEKSVSRDVQESILSKGMTLVFDMKLHRLERVSRCTGSPILTSDSLMNQKLKQCESFHIEKFVEEHAGIGEGGKQSIITLMFIEGCPTCLGCTILLKGSNSDELKRIKRVVHVAVVIAYHLLLETSFLVDQRAMFSTIPFDGLAETLPSAQPSPALEIVDSSVSQFQGSIARSKLCEVDVPISNGFHEVSHISDEVSGENSTLFNEPYDPAVFSRFSSLSASLKKVIEDGFPLSSSASYQSLSAYLGFNGRKPNGQTQITEEIPVSKILEADHCGMEAKGSFNEEKLHDDRKHQPLAVCSESPQTMGKVGCEKDQRESGEGNNTVLDSESILVLMSRRNALKGTICEHSHFSHIMFYRNYDVPLGKFLRDNLLNQITLCSTCNELPEAHFYYYAHHNKLLTIQVKHRSDKKSLPGEAEGKIWMWSRCGKCKIGNGVSKSTKRVLISTAARCLSFGKFLELSFSDHCSSKRLSSCGHLLHSDFLYFFGLGPMVAIFKYSQVMTCTVSVPPQKLELSNTIRQDWLRKELVNVYMKGMLLFSEVSGSLKQIQSQFAGSSVKLGGSLNEFSDIEEMLKQETFEFEANIKCVVAKNGSPDLAFHKLLSLNRLLWELLLESFVWDHRLHSLLLPDSRGVDARATQETLQDQFKSNTDGIAGRGSVRADIGDGDKVSGFSNFEVKLGTSAEVKEFSDKEITVDGIEQECEGEVDLCTALEENIERSAMDVISSNRSPCHEFNMSYNFSACHSFEENCQPGKFPSSDHLPMDRIIPISTDGGNDDSICNASVPRKGSSPCPLSSDLIKSDEWFWMPFSKIRQIYMNDLRRGCLAKYEPASRYAEDHLPTVLQLITEEGSRLHIPLGSDGYIVSDYEGELSSIIACALAWLKVMPTATEVPNDDSWRENGMATILTDSLHSLIQIPTMTTPHWSFTGTLGSDSVHSTVSNSSEESRFSSFDGLNLLDFLLPPEILSPEVSLGVTKSLGKGKYSVTCLYANQFRDFRSQCCTSELDYIASLSRCRNWDAKGGKSKSFFAKTLDDRLIIKEIKKTEYDSFDKFAPHYFKYMTHSFESGSQTCLAKILGIYQVIIRQTKSGKEMRHDLMVMENLTFGRNIARQYDLKGALHARLNSAADGSEDVLLDQNFVNDMNCSPLYVSNTAKRLLLRAVWNDTTFLNSINVMDYSLLVGFDAQRKELVCGIIDYLRQYTWDKQLETWVKSSLVVPKNVLPTIISPKEYKKRFRKFMSTHFLSVPDHWCSQES